MRWIVRTIQNLYKIHITTKSPDRIRFFHNMAFLTETLFKTIAVLYTSSVLVYYSYAIFVYITTNQLIPLVPFHLPLVDETTSVGLFILNIYLLVINSMSIAGLVAMDFFTAVITISTLIFAKLISLDLNQINADMLAGASRITVYGRFRNVLLMHQEMVE